MTEWERFERALAGVLGALTIDQYLVVTTRAGNRFVQFAGQGCGGLRAETASNRVLEANERLEASGLDRLDALGWNRPTHEIDDDDEHESGSCNYYFDYKAPVPLATVADQSVQTLTQVFRVQHPNELVYYAFVDNGPPLLLPTLGLEVDASGWPSNPAADCNLSIEDLQGRVFEVLDDAFDDVELDEGYVRIPFGSAFVMVRVLGDPPIVNLFSAVVEGITLDSRLLLEELNQRNLGARFVRFVAMDDTVIASYELFGRPFVPAHLIYAVNLIGDLATAIDVEFCDRFGGHSFYPESDGEGS